MPTLSTMQLPPPKSWDEFEIICADLFSRIWANENTVRHGRQGQRQNGVDIYAMNKEGKYVGVQCKGKSIWPPRALTIKEITDEVEKALKFVPTLAEFTFATTSPDDVEIQSHVRLICDDHKKKGLFSVHVLGWEELTRRLTNYKDLIEKHYPILSAPKIENLDDLIRNVIDNSFKGSSMPIDLIDKEINRQIDLIKKQRYLSLTYQEDALSLAQQIRSGHLKLGSNAVRSHALAWLARILAKNHTELATSISKEATELDNTEESRIARAFVLAAIDDIPNAIAAALASRTSKSISAVFTILLCFKGPDVALQWIKESDTKFSQLDAYGKYSYIQINVEKQEWNECLECADSLTPLEYEIVPTMLCLSGIVYLVQVVAPEFRNLFKFGVPFNFPAIRISSTSSAAAHVEKARNLFAKASTSLAAIGLPDDSARASDFVLWLNLLNSNLNVKANAIEELRNSMRDRTHRLRRLGLALYFDINLDIHAVQKEIDREAALMGGKSTETNLARFTLVFFREAPENVFQYIEHHRDELISFMDNTTLVYMQIALLAKASKVENAKELLNQNKLDLNVEQVEKLKTLIEECTSDNPLQIRLDAYKQNQSFENLQAIVALLEQSGDLENLYTFSKLLFEQTENIQDAERMARVFHDHGKFEDLSIFLDRYLEFINQSQDIHFLQCWRSYVNGDMDACRENLSILRTKRDRQEDFNLSIQLAVTSGNWESLNDLVEIEWGKRNARSAVELLQFGQLAQQIGSAKQKDFIRLAVSISDNNPNILIHAYELATKGGWENSEEVGTWLNNAIIEPDNDRNDVIRKVSIQEIMELAPDWNKRKVDVWEQLRSGKIPVCGAAKLLNRSLIDMFLLPSLYNAKESDARKRTPVYAFSGNIRNHTVVPKSIAMDATALLTLALLKQTENIISEFFITIPHTTLNWIFDERRKAQFHQPSRIAKQKRIQRLLADGTLNYLRLNSIVDPDLLVEVGNELASFISDIHVEPHPVSSRRVILCKYPIYKNGSLMNEEADLSKYDDYFASAKALLEYLNDRGLLTAVEEATARERLCKNESDWPNQLRIQHNDIIYITSLVLEHLQHAGLIAKLKSCGLNLFIFHDELSEEKALLEFDEYIEEADEILEQLRHSLSQGIADGRVKLGRRPFTKSESDLDLTAHPSINVFSLSPLVDALVVDDRALNHTGIYTSATGSTPILTTWDLITHLRDKGIINDINLMDARTKICRAGYQMIPPEVSYIHDLLNGARVENGVIKETYELKSLRENIFQCQMNRTLQLPSEMEWIKKLKAAFVSVICSIWNGYQPETEKRARSNWVMQFLDVRNWSPILVQRENEEIEYFGLEHKFMNIFSVFSMIDPENIDAYNNWVDTDHLTDLKLRCPTEYKNICIQIRSIIEYIVKNHRTVETDQ